MKNLTRVALRNKALRNKALRNKALRNKTLTNKALIMKSLFLVLSVLSISAQARVGQVLYSIGNVTVEKPAISSLIRKAIIDEGDVIVTGAKSYVQLKLDDGTKLAIRPNSRFVIESLTAPATATTPAIGSGVALTARFNLQKGGFRTITGRIAKRDPSVYQLTTPSAVIGVRGTNYQARICAADCNASVDGLYVGVSDGGISMNNAGGDLDLGTNQFGYAANFNTPPTRLIAPPSGLQDDGLALLEEEEEEEEEESGDSSDEESSDEESSEESTDDAAEESTDDAAEESTDDAAEESTDDAAAEESTDDTAAASSNESAEENTGEIAADRGGDVSASAAATATTSSVPTVTTTTAVDEVDQTISVASGGDLTDGQTVPVDEVIDEVVVVDDPVVDEPIVDEPTRSVSFALGPLASGINANISDVTVDDGSNLIGFIDPSVNGLVYNIGTAVNRNTGFDPSSGLRWGRWADGIATQSGADGSSNNIDLTNQGLHWITSAEADIPVQQITGSQGYQLVGNTDPSDNLGNIGVLGSATFSADFTNNSVQSSLALSINQSVWNASGSGTITSNLFSGLYGTVTVNGEVNGSGSFGGIFAGFGDGSALPLGAGLNYQLTNGTTTVSGAAVFNSPQQNK